MKPTLTYRLTGPGWSKATISDGVQSATLTACFLSDALWQLTEALIALLRGIDRTDCRFAEEPGEYRWLFERHGETVALTIRWFNDTFSTRDDAAGTVVFATEVGLRRLAVQLSNQLHELLKTHGVEGYQALARYPFPSREHETLARLIRETRPTRPTPAGSPASQADRRR